MRFLVDECTGPGVAEWLRGRGYEVFSVYDEARGMRDSDLIRKAHREGWILLTNDKDFGEKVHRERMPHRGVVLLRLQDERSVRKIEALDGLLANHWCRLADRFVVVTSVGVRFARSGGPPA